jgi:hypothetical protein
MGKTKGIITDILLQLQICTIQRYFTDEKQEVLRLSNVSVFFGDNKIRRIGDVYSNKQQKICVTYDFGVLRNGGFLFGRASRQV